MIGSYLNNNNNDVAYTFLFIVSLKLMDYV